MTTHQTKSPKAAKSLIPGATHVVLMNVTNASQNEGGDKTLPIWQIHRGHDHKLAVLTHGFRFSGTCETVDLDPDASSPFPNGPSDGFEITGTIEVQVSRGGKFVPLETALADGTLKYAPLENDDNDGPETDAIFRAMLDEGGDGVREHDRTLS